LIRADRDHQPAADLIAPLGTPEPAARRPHDDGIIRGVLQPPPGTVAMQDAKCVARSASVAAAFVSELAETFDRCKLGSDLRQHRGGVARARTDLEDLLAALAARIPP